MSKRVKEKNSFDREIIKVDWNPLCESIYTGGYIANPYTYFEYNRRMCVPRN